MVEDAAERDRPVAGFFGKLPSTGDFVERGLPPAFRSLWDRWLTTHIAPRARDGARFPDGGLRFRLVSGGATASGVILSSQDSVGRVFPLSLLVIAKGGLAEGAVDLWCDAAVAEFDPAMGPDALWEMLDAIAAPDGTADAGEPVLLLWAKGHIPAAFEEGADLVADLLPGSG